MTLPRFTYEQGGGLTDKDIENLALFSGQSRPSPIRPSEKEIEEHLQKLLSQRKGTEEIHHIGVFNSSANEAVKGGDNSRLVVEGMEPVLSPAHIESFMRNHIRNGGKLEDVVLMATGLDGQRAGEVVMISSNQRYRYNPGGDAAVSMAVSTADRMNTVTSITGIEIPVLRTMVEKLKGSKLVTAQGWLTEAEFEVALDLTNEELKKVVSEQTNKLKLSSDFESTTGLSIQEITIENSRRYSSDLEQSKKDDEAKKSLKISGSTTLFNNKSKEIIVKFPNIVSLNGKVVHTRDELNQAWKEITEDASITHVSIGLRNDAGDQNVVIIEVER